MWTTLMGNNMHKLVLNIPVVLVYLIHEINEFMHKQGEHVTLFD